MFYVIHGYCGPGRCAKGHDGPILEVKLFNTAAQVEKFFMEFTEGIGREDSHVTFRVIEGQERVMKAVERVTEYKLE